MFGKIVALVQGHGTTSSDAPVFPACFRFHTMARGEVEASTCLEVCFSPKHDEELQLIPAQSPPSQLCAMALLYPPAPGEATTECELLLMTPS